MNPASDDDSYAVIDDALAALAARRHSNLGDDIETIGLLASLIDQAERFLPELVTNSRENGASWRRIAQTLGTSPDEARLRFAPDSPIADTRWPYNF
ncbi:hypothetical protein CVS30_10355 [Arthrobacter psychrolactophilus]|uniref:HNH endonuclease n=1 Tax=Arthrobacter psychrolactophilus TaxID=92442 RepID=A0A2V5IPN1_9MICC|nr:hypothetical protein CVS30_10355 [Arthrobacter psychrolactophilus]